MSPGNPILAALTLVLTLFTAYPARADNTELSAIESVAAVGILARVALMLHDAGIATAAVGTAASGTAVSVALAGAVGGAWLGEGLSTPLLGDRVIAKNGRLLLVKRSLDFSGHPYFITTREDLDLKQAREINLGAIFTRADSKNVPVQSEALPATTEAQAKAAFDAHD